MTVALLKEHKDALNKLRLHLIEMKPELVTEYLFSNKALSLDHKQIIKSKGTNDDKNRTLMKILEQQKDWVYHCFLDSLQQSGQNNVLNILGESKPYK